MLTALLPHLYPVPVFHDNWYTEGINCCAWGAYNGKHEFAYNTSYEHCVQRYTISCRRQLRMIARQAEVGWLEIITYGVTAKKYRPECGPRSLLSPGYYARLQIHIDFSLIRSSWLQCRSPISYRRTWPLAFRGPVPDLPAEPSTWRVVPRLDSKFSDPEGNPNCQIP